MSLMTNVREALELRRVEDVDTELKVGIELEYENLSVDPVSSLPSPQIWRSEGDGSLRNGGIELISIPLIPDDVPQALRLVESRLRPLRPSASPRCGIHVHMNVRHLTVCELFSIITAYTLMEPSIFARWCPERLTSSFCVPVYKNQVMQRAATNCVIAARRGITHSLSDLANTSKYSALNTSSLRSFGTIEARLLPSTLDFDRLQRWVDTLLLLYNASIQFKDPNDVIEWYESNNLKDIQTQFLGEPQEVDDREQRRAYISAAYIAGNPYDDMVLEDPTPAEAVWITDEVPEPAPPDVWDTPPPRTRYTTRNLTASGISSQALARAREMLNRQIEEVAGDRIVADEVEVDVEEDIDMDF